MKAAAGVFRLGLVALLCFLFGNLTVQADTIYVACTDSELLKFDTVTGNGFTLSSNGCWQLALDSSGMLYGTAGNSVYQYDSSANESVYGTAPSASDLKGLAFDNSGNLYAADWYGGGSIYKFDTNGQSSLFLSNLPEPINVAFDASGNLYVANWYGGIQKFDASGDFLSQWGSGGPGLFGAYGLAFDSHGDLFAVSNNSGIIVKIDTNGNETTFATGMSNPYGLAIDSSDNLYVTLVFDGTILKFDPSGHETTFATGLHEPIGIAIQVPEPSTWLLALIGVLFLAANRQLRQERLK